VKVLVGFIDEHRDEFGVEFICKSLRMAPSTYYAAKHRETTPSARARRDAQMAPVIEALWLRNRKVYGADKLWRAARRADHDIGRDQVARLMRDLGICGVSRQRKKVFTTKSDPDAVRAPDLVNRDFTAEAPDQLYKTECVYGPDAPRPWEDVEELELATLSWVHWFNHERLHRYCGHVPPAEFEAAFYAAQQADPAGVGNQ
jgi:putative transposase